MTPARCTPLLAECIDPKRIFADVLCLLSARSVLHGCCRCFALSKVSCSGVLTNVGVIFISHSGGVGSARAGQLDLTAVLKFVAFGLKSRNCE